MKIKNTFIDKDGYQLVDIQSVTVPIVVPSVESSLRDVKFVKAVYRNVNDNKLYSIYFLNYRSSILNRLKFKRLAANKSFIEILAQLNSSQMSKQPAETIAHLTKEQIEELLSLSSDKNDAEKIARAIRYKKQEAKRNLESPIRNNNLNRM